MAAGGPVAQLRRPVAIASVFVLLAVPFVVLLVRATRTGWLPTADLAAIELRVRDVGGTHTPLVGTYSRFGWNHPGPLLFYVLAVPYRLLGSPTWGLLASATLVNAMWVGGCAWLLWRRGGLAGLVLGSVPLVLLVHALGGTFLEDAWNPYLIVLGLFALALLVWSVACGDHVLLPAAIAVASFCVQAHVGSLLPAAALVFVALVFFAVDARRRRVRHLRRLVVVSAAVGVALWIPAIVQELQSGRGNLTELWDFWTSSHSSMPGLATGARIVGPQFGVTPPFLTGHESVNVFTAGVDPHWTVPLGLVLLLGATAVAYARRDRASFTLDFVALVLAVAAWISVARVVDTPFFYIVRWVWIVGGITWLAIGWTAARAVRAWLSNARVGTVATAVAAAAVVVLLFLVGAATVAASRATPRDSVEAALLHRIAGPARAHAGHGRGPVLIDSGRTFVSVELARGLLLDFTRAGINARGPRRDADAVGSHRVIAPARAGRTIVIASEDDEIARYTRDPNFRVVTRADLLTRAERAEYEAQAREIAANYSHLESWARDHPDVIARQLALEPRAARAVVFERV